MNTFLMNVGQRRRQLAVMRAIGVTRRQISGLLAREAMLLTLVGTLLGIVAGLAGKTSEQYDEQLVPNCAAVDCTETAAARDCDCVRPGRFPIGHVLPARQAARVTPQEGMSGVASGDVEGHSRRGVLVGLAVTLTAAGLLAACLVGWLPFEASVVVTVVALIGLVLLLPFVLRPLTYLGEVVLRPVAGIEVRFARRQLLRHYGRTTLTIGVLFVAVSTGLGLANSVVDNVADVRHWYQTAIVGDFFVRAAMPDMEIGLSAAVPESVGTEIQGIDGVTRIDSVRFVSAKINDQPAFVVALRNEFRSPSEMQQGDSPLLQSLPQDDRVTIGSVLAQRTGLHAGDSITLDTSDGPRQLPISAVANEYAAGGLTVRMNRALAERLLNIEGVDAYVVKAEHQKLESKSSNPCGTYAQNKACYCSRTPT